MPSRSRKYTDTALIILTVPPRPGEGHAFARQVFGERLQACERRAEGEVRVHVLAVRVGFVRITLLGALLDQLDQRGADVVENVARLALGAVVGLVAGAEKLDPAQDLLEKFSRPLRVARGKTEVVAAGERKPVLLRLEARLEPIFMSPLKHFHRITPSRRMQWPSVFFRGPLPITRFTQMNQVLSCSFACAMHGVEGLIVRVETDAWASTPAISIIGLPDRSLNESGSRVRSALINSGFTLPAGHLLVNLSPADVRGSILDSRRIVKLRTVDSNSETPGVGVIPC